LLALYRKLAELKRRTQAELAAARYTEAEVLARRMLELHPNDLEGLDLLLEALYRQHRLPEALEVARRLVDLQPGDFNSNLKLAELLRESGDLAQAGEYFVYALESEPPEYLRKPLEELSRSLDIQQVREIVMLAREDTTFRLELLQDTEEAVAQRGFRLSNKGLAVLEKLVRTEQFSTLVNRPFRGYN